MKITELKKVLPSLFEANITPMLVGSHGVGKTESVAQFAKENKYLFIPINLGTMSDAGDIIGIPERGKFNGIEDVTVFLKTDWAAEVLHYSKTNPNSKVIIFLDEINRARRDMLQAIFSLVLEKRIHTIKFPSNVHIIAAMNPNTEDYTVTEMSDNAFLDRFCHIKINPTVEEWIDYAKENDYDDNLIDFIRVQPDLLSAKMEDFSLEDIKPSRRSWSAIDRILKTEIANDDGLIKEISFGLVGVAPTIAFFKHRNNKEEMVSAEDIIKKYSKVKNKIKALSENSNEKRLDVLKVVSEKVLDTLFALKKVTPSHMKNVIEYIIDIPKDLGFMVVRDLFLKAYESNKEVHELLCTNEELITHFDGINDEKTA